MNYLVLIPSRPRFYRAKLTWVWNDVIVANILAPCRKWIKICLVNFQHLDLFQFLPRFELPTNRFEVKHRIHFTTQADSMAYHQSENVRANFFALSRWSKKKQIKTKQKKTVTSNYWNTNIMFDTVACLWVEHPLIMNETSCWVKGQWLCRHYSLFFPELLTGKYFLKMARK